MSLRHLTQLFSSWITSQFKQVPSQFSFSIFSTVKSVCTLGSLQAKPTKPACFQHSHRARLSEGPWASMRGFSKPRRRFKIGCHQESRSKRIRRSKTLRRQIRQIRQWWQTKCENMKKKQSRFRLGTDLGQGRPQRGGFGRTCPFRRDAHLPTSKPSATFHTLQVLSLLLVLKLSQYKRHIS